MAKKATALEGSAQPTKPRKIQDDSIHISQACTIDVPAADLYRFWRRFENLPRFMSHLESVTGTDGRISHWKVQAPMGRELEWDAEIVSDEPDRLIAWRSLQGSDVESAGSVCFAETGDRGTEVRVVMDYVPPAGKLGNLVATLIGENPSAALREDLRRLKQLMETGEMATNQSPRGTCGHSKNAKNDGASK